MHPVRKSKPVTTIQSFRDLAKRFGYQIPSNAEFYCEKRDGNRVGMKIGEYVHVCHIDTTDIFVLLYMTEDGDVVDTVANFWLERISV